MRNFKFLVISFELGIMELGEVLSFEFLTESFGIRVLEVVMAESVIQQKSFKFALATVSLYKRLQAKREFVLSKQLLRSGTSIGANVEEATAAQSRRDFLSKMSIASKEARETKYWLRLLQESDLVDMNLSLEIAQIDEIVRILTAIVKTTQKTS